MSRRSTDSDIVEVRARNRTSAEHDPSVRLHRAVAEQLDALADAINVTVDPAAGAWMNAEACGRREVYRLIRQHANQLRSAGDAAPHTQRGSMDREGKDRE